MSRSKTRQRPTPRRTRTRPLEVRTPIPGHAQGAKACIVIRRKGQLWSVTDHFRGDPAYVGAGEVWQELTPEVPTAEVFRWSEADARRLMSRFVAQATEIHRNNAGPLSTARRIESLVADMAPPEVMPQVLTLAEVDARLREAQAEVAARAKKDVPLAPAPMDLPDYQPRTRDTVSLQQPLTLLGASIPANWEDPTVAIQQFPPMPPQPPTVHLTYLTEAHPDAGARIRESVAEAMAAAS